MVREDISAQQWNDYFERRVFVSDAEARSEFLASQEKRKVKYVLLSSEAAKKSLAVAAAEVQKLLSDPAKAAVLKSRFEAQKETAYKGKTFEQVKDALARDMLASERFSDAQKKSETVAEQIKGLLAAEKGSDAKVNAALKAGGFEGVEVKTSEWFTRESPFVPGVGEANQLVRDAFAKTSPLAAGQGGKAAKYLTAGGTVVAVLADAQKADPSKFDAERDQLIRRIATRKQNELFQGWMEGLVKKASVDPNPAVVGEDS
ncbi:MAG: hypothetical protein NDJ90_11855, partial [Oligoflexia bacterium]|nr:hypothetical protein [Oligoflexia bacterium]